MCVNQDNVHTDQHPDCLSITGVRRGLLSTLLWPSQLLLKSGTHGQFRLKANLDGLANPRDNLKQVSQPRKGELSSSPCYFTNPWSSTSGQILQKWCSYEEYCCQDKSVPLRHFASINVEMLSLPWARIGTYLTKVMPVKFLVYASSDDNPSSLPLWSRKLLLWSCYKCNRGAII